MDAQAHRQKFKMTQVAVSYHVISIDLTTRANRRPVEHRSKWRHHYAAFALPLGAVSLEFVSVGIRVMT